MKSLNSRIVEKFESRQREAWRERQQARTQRMLLLRRRDGKQATTRKEQMK